MTLVSDSLLELTAQNNPTVSSELSAHPNEKIINLAEKLYKPNSLTKVLDKLSLSSHHKQNHAIPSQLDLDRAVQCGNFNQRPSDLFLKMFIDALLTIEQDPLAGLVSPPLMASTGVLPLSIISVIPDIMDHYADVIVRARAEIFFATNFWEASGNAKTITDAFLELSRRAGERGEKVVIKLMYDRGNPKQVVEPHQFVDPKEYTGERVKLPSPEEIPNIDLQVVNFHKPPVGTFHAKYVVVDRKIVLLNSNNIQDRVNVEMMTHIEGDIVNAFYDMALLSWNNTMTPPLPFILSPPQPQSTFEFGNDHPTINVADGTGQKSRDLLKEHHEHAKEDTAQEPVSTTPSDSKEEKVYDKSNADEFERIQANISTEQQVSDHLNTGTKISATAPEHVEEDLPFHPLILHQKHEPFPMALVNRRPHGKPGHKDTKCPQDAAFLAAFRFASRKVFIQTPTFNAPLVVDAAIAAVKRGIEVIIYVDLGFNDEGELLPRQGGTNEMVCKSMYAELETDEQKELLKMYWYTGKDQATPLNAKDKSRNCHVKLLIVDDSVGIQGNGNQDVQSWYHSQEINVMIDSAAVCKEWADGIRSNQNTHLYGRLDKDGIWRDKEGKTLPGATGGPTGPFKSLTGVKGAIQRVRGEGGF